MTQVGHAERVSSSTKIKEKYNVTQHIQLNMEYKHEPK